MSLKKTLAALFKEIAHEIAANEDFRSRIESALALYKTQPSQIKSKVKKSSPKKRARNRRSPALIDPVHLARQGEGVLRTALSHLNVEQLRDVIADHAMDPGKLSLRWRDPERMIERIIDVAKSRAQKGNAFREQPTHDESTEIKNANSNNQM